MADKKEKDHLHTAPKMHRAKKIQVPLIFLAQVAWNFHVSLQIKEINSRNSTIFVKMSTIVEFFVSSSFI